MRPICFLFLIAAALLLVYPAAAADVSITFADLNIIKGVHILIYNNTGSFMGEFNSTDTATIDSAQSYIFVLKPTSQSWFTSASGTIDVLGAYLPITVNYMIAGVFILGIAYAISRMWK